MKNKDIVSRFDALFNERQGTVDGTWNLVERFVMPLRGEFYTSLSSEGEVDWRRREIYDSTAVFAAQSLAAAMQSNLTNPSQRWFDLRFRNAELNTETVVRDWLETCTDLMYQALEESNFSVEISEAYTDLVGYGTAVVTEEIDETGELLFSTNPLRDLVFDQDHKKDVHTLYRRLQWTPIQIVSKFGDKVPDKIKKKAESPQTMTEEIIFCVYPRKDKAADPNKPTAPKERPYGYKYVLKNGLETLGEEGGYYEMPSYVARWRTVAGSKWGKSPAIDAMGDILTLNQLKEATLEAAGKAIDPAQLVEDGALIGDLNLDRGSKTVMVDINGIRPNESGTRFDVSNMEVSDHREMIRNHFFQNQLELKESPAMTATEVNVRYELMQRLIGPALSRLKHDLLNPMVQRTFNIMYREGKLPPLPEGIEESRLNIEYTGPLARAQKSGTADAIMRWLGESAQLSEAYPDARELPNAEEGLRIVAELRGVPIDAVRSEQELNMMRQQRQEQQAQAQQMQALTEGAGALESAGKGVQALSAVE